MSHRFKIYGIFRSGTNLLRHLVEGHLDATCDINEGGHKHLFTPQNWTKEGYVPQLVDMLVCVKDPYAAMVSLFNYAERVRFRHFHCATDWPNFLTERFVVAIDRSPKPPAFRFRDPVDYWNAFYFHMLSVVERPVTFVRYEEILTDPDAVIRGISTKFGVAKRGTAVLPRLRIKNMPEDRPDNPFMDDHFDVAWYSQRKYMKEYNEAQVDYMREFLDNDILNKFHYGIVR